MTAWRRLCLTGVVISSLASCANLANVRTFGDATKTVSTATQAIITDDQASCDRRGAIVAEYYKIVQRPMPPHDCTRLQTVLKGVLVTNQALAAYASALSSLAQDSVVTFTAEGTEATNTLKGIPGVSADQATAVGDLAAFVASAATSGYRQREIDKAMTGKMAENFKTTVAVLQQLARQYHENLVTEVTALDLTGLGLGSYERAEPLAGAEFENRIDRLKADIKNHQDALDEYEKSLSAMLKAFDGAVTDLSHPTTEQLLDSVKGFASQANAVRQAVQKAFPSL